MYNNIKHIKLQGEIYTPDKLTLLCNQKIANSDIQAWEKEIYLFLKDWFSSSNTITVTTSGSTGTPKKIILQKTHMIASAKATLSFFKLLKDDNTWLCLPIKYIAGKMMIVRSLVGGLNINYSQPTASPMLDPNLKINFAAMVPNQVFTLLSVPKGIQQLQNIRNLLIGGAVTTPELENRLLKLTDVNIWHSYGMTETITHIAMRKVLSDAKINCFFPLSDVKVSTNQDSQLIIDAPAIGVVNLLTNDIAHVHDDGSFSIFGRVDNVVISGGIKLYPESIENEIRKYINYNFFVGGIPDSKLGVKLILFIESTPINKNSADMLKYTLKNNLSKFEIPKEIVYLKEFLITKTDKIRRNTMINKYIDELR